MAAPGAGAHSAACGARSRACACAAEGARAGTGAALSMAMRIVGYKWLCVEASLDDARGITLRSAFDAHVWTRGTNLANYAPSEENMWGFNAYYSAVRARWAGRNYGMVIVGVVGYGSVALFHRGWRAEKAEIVAVYLPRRFTRRWRLGKDSLASFSERLSATYDVPVFRSLRSLREETLRWGLPSEHFLANAGPADGPPEL